MRDLQFVLKIDNIQTLANPRDLGDAKKTSGSIHGREAADITVTDIIKGRSP